MRKVIDIGGGSGKINNKNKGRERENDIDFYGTPNSQVIQKELAHWIGDNMYQKYLEEADGEEAKKFIRTSYRKSAVIGDGGTSSIRKMEKATGLNLGRNGNNHAQKVDDLIRQIHKSLTKDMSARDRSFLLERLRELEEVQDK